MRKTTHFSLVVLAALSAHASMIPLAIASPSPDALKQEPFSPTNCALPDGWDEIADREPRYIVFGEIHGTHEAPQFVGSIACALASKGKKVLLALELDAVDNKQLQVAWNGSNSKFERRLLKSGWAGRDDGVASMSMKHMLAQLHKSFGRGRGVSVVAFNGYGSAAQETRLSKLQGQQGHEIGQAENIQIASNRENYDLVLILVGNIHARKTEVRHGGQSFKPMAMHLGSLNKVVTLNMATSGGSAWNCIPKRSSGDAAVERQNASSLDCAIHPYHSDDQPKKKSPFVGLGSISEDPDNASYDGYFWLGPVSGSPPAIRVLDTEARTSGS